MSEARMTLIEAIARKKVVAAQYNGTQIRLAPHLMFERHGDLFVHALNLSKAWKSDDERKLGQYKLAGLVAPKLLDEPFAPLPAFDAATPRPDDALVLAI